MRATLGSASLIPGNKVPENLKDRRDEEDGTGDKNVPNGAANYAQRRTSRPLAREELSRLF